MLLSAIVADASVSKYLGYGSMAHLFKGSEIAVHEFVHAFIKQYGAIPSADTIKAHTQELLTPHKEPAEYYLDLMQVRHIELTVKQAMQKASDLLLPASKDPIQSLEVLTQAVMLLATQKSQKQIMDLRDAYELIIPEYVQQYSSEIGNRLMLGWPTLDKMTAGIVRGDLVSFVGRPAVGKSYSLLYGAHHGWGAAGKQFAKTGIPQEGAARMFISMEMQKLPIAQRLAAMQAHIPMEHLKHAALSTGGLKKLKGGLIEFKGYGAPFWIVDGNLTATVEDIFMLVRQLKPDAIFIDGAYLLKHPKENDRFRRVAENVELIKMELCPLAPVVCSWQFSRSADKKKGKKGLDGEVGLDDIGSTDAIGQTSSVVCGMFEENSVETINRRKVKIMKGRNGEVGEFSINWKFSDMDFSEVSNTSVEDLQFL